MSGFGVLCALVAESMWQLGLGGPGDAAVVVAYPERPGEPDCAYFMRTGTCGYGDRCRYNHPRERVLVTTLKKFLS